MSLYQYGDRRADMSRAPGVLTAPRTEHAANFDAAVATYIAETGFRSAEWTQICQRAGILLDASNALCIQHTLATKTFSLQAALGVFDSDMLNALTETINAHVLTDFQPNRFQRADDFRPLILNHLPHMIGADRDCHSLVIGFGLGSDSFALLALIRPGSAPVFKPDDLARAKAVGAFIREAAARRVPRQADWAQQSPSKLVFDLLPFGIISLNEQNQIEFSNRIADLILSKNDGLTRMQQTIAAVSMRDNSALHAALAHCRSNMGQDPVAQILLIQRRDERRPFSVTVQSKCLDGKASGALIYIVDPNVDTYATIANICAAYGLTPVETELTCHIISGMTLLEAASALRIKPDTARGYLKRIFSKLGVNRQVELVRLLLSSFIPSSMDETNNLV